ncbi:MAG: dihydrofolate reductase family protein [Candidatus Promineifilaceae bacterium]
MSQPVLQLLPQPTQEYPLEGLYLNHNLRQYRGKNGRAFMFSNYVVSLDGRIAVPHPTRPGLTVPKAIANDRDWRLFQELAAQSDIILSNGRYLRDVADGRAQELLQIDDPQFADLHQWRKQQGLPPYPDIAIISRTLDFPIPDLLTKGGRKVLIFTGANPNPKRVAELEMQAGQVIVAGESSVEGKQMVDQLTRMGYGVVFAASGPKVLHMLLASGVLDRLYLTQTSRLLGGDPFAPIVEGVLLSPPYDMMLQNLYYDPNAPANLGQLFSVYDKVQQ